MKKQVCLFILFLLVLLSKNVLFHAYVFASSMPWGFWQYLFAKLSVALVIASFVFISRRPWWTLVALVLIDIWTVTNWVYYQANGLFVTVSMLGIAGNLHGFTGAVTSFIDIRVLWLVLLTLLYGAVFFIGLNHLQRHVLPFAGTLAAGVLMVMASNLILHTERSKKGYNDGPLTFAKILPFYINEQRMLTDWESEYSLVRDHSIIGYLPLHVIYEKKLSRFKNDTHESLTGEEQALMERLWKPTEPEPFPNSNLLFVLVESLEAWALEYEGVTPRMNALRRGAHTIYADKIFSQARHGVSGDGQLILNTGLLPLQSGVACILYGTNTYPNIAHLYPRSVVVNPSKGTWNQHVVTPSYGYQGLIEPESTSEETDWSDADICKKTAAWMCANDSLSCVQVITVSSHSPFNRVSGAPDCITPDTPEELRRYLTCIHYADSCIGLLMDSLEAQGRMNNTTVVITGDHIFFHGDKRNSFMPFAQAHQLPISHWNYYVPLIICSPYIGQPVTVEEVCYQMDIFPTVLHVIGCEEYAWKGVGVNLLDADAIRHRTLSQDEAYCLSDKLIRSNWFAYE